MKCKKYLSVFLCMVLLAAAMLPAAFAKEADTAVVTFLFANGETIRPFFNLTVTDGTAEAYGYTPAEKDHAGKTVETVSALDVLAAAHRAVYGDAFTAQSADAYLSVSYGFASKAFTQSGSFGFSLNDVTPHDDVLVTSDWGTYYTGYALDTTRVKTGDIITLYMYTDAQGWSDLYPTFAEKSLQVQPGETFSVSADGYNVMMYGSSEQSVIDANTIPMAGAKLCWTQDFQTYTPAGTLDAQGSAALSVSAPGTRYLVVCGTVDGTPVIANYCTVTVSEAQPDPVAEARWIPVGLRPVLQLQNHILTLGISVRLHDLNKTVSDCRRIYAIQFCFNGTQRFIQFICNA